MKGRILLVEDDETFAFALGRVLKAQGYESHAVADGGASLAAMRSQSFDAVLLDLGLPDASGHDVLVAMVESDPNVPVIVLSGRDDAASAVRAMKAGAWDYLTKPIGAEELSLVIERARDRARLRTRVEAAMRGAGATNGVGSSPAWLRAIESVRAAAAAPRTPVLVTGESGTGKEVCAALVHAESDRAQGPFITVNAGAFTPSLLESELFGHEAGAFTGARTAKRGVFELAAGGTLFLDELGELPLDLQPKLLRVLDGHPFRRVGGEREIRADVRLVSATNRSLEREVREGRFRLDLYHRLRVVEVALPPLRERSGDVELLTAHFLAALSRELRVPVPSMSSDALEAFRAYDWPGNVRELRNVLERAVVLRRGAEIGLRDLPSEIARARAADSTGGGHPSSVSMSFAGGSGARVIASGTPLRALHEVEKEHVLSVFRVCEQNLSRAARVLEVSRMTLRKKLRDYGVIAREEEPDVR